MTATGYVFSSDELAACAEREVKFRERVYRARVENRRMRPEQANREISMMRQIASDYRRQAEGDSLFGRK